MTYSRGRMLHVHTARFPDQVGVSSKGAAAAAVRAIARARERERAKGDKLERRQGADGTVEKGERINACKAYSDKIGTKATISLTGVTLGEQVLF